MLYNNLYRLIPSMETYSSHLETHSEGKIVVSGFLPSLALVNQVKMRELQSYNLISASQIVYFLTDAYFL